jgi:hypothetical protein
MACSSDGGGPDRDGDGGSTQRDDGGSAGRGQEQGGEPSELEAGAGSVGGAPGELPGRGGTGGGPVGAVPAELVGVWQQTRASAGEYTNGFGEDFSITSGFSAQLRIAEDGSYLFTHFASGASLSCGSVSYLDRSVGAAVLEGDVLSLVPTQRELEVHDCGVDETREVPLDPIPLTISVEEAFNTYYGGLRTYVMNVEGGPHPLELTLLHRPPLAEPPQPEPPADFSLGSDPPFQELQGTWVASKTGTDTGFFDPETGELHFPELNGSPHQWLRFAGEQYETAVALQNLNPEGVCKSDLIYYERGNALLQVLEDVNGQGSHFVGHIRLEATAARLIVRVRECDVDDAVYQYDVPGQLSYYRWIYFSPASSQESFQLRCEFPKSEWQATLCESAQYVRLD